MGLPLTCETIYSLSNPSDIPSVSHKSSGLSPLSSFPWDSLEETESLHKSWDVRTPFRYGLYSRNFASAISTSASFCSAQSLQSNLSHSEGLLLAFRIWVKEKEDSISVGILGRICQSHGSVSFVRVLVQWIISVVTCSSSTAT